MAKKSKKNEDVDEVEETDDELEEGAAEADADAADDDDDADADDEDEDADDDDDDDDADDDDDDDDDADDDDDDEDDEEEEEAPPKPAPKKAKTKASGDKPKRRKPRARPRPRRREPKPSPNRNVVLFVAMVGGLAAAFGFLGSTSTPFDAKPSNTKWKIGATVPVEITLVSPDYKNLGCAMKTPVKGLTCARETKTKVFPKVGNARTNPKLLQPFTTTDRHQFLAAGLWTDPALKAKLDKENFDKPGPRFSVKCSFKVEGRAPRADIQWKPGEGWHSGNGWLLGSVSKCKLK